MATTRFIDHLIHGDFADRPAAGDVPQGALYGSDDTGIIYQSDGVSTWTAWATFGNVADITDLPTSETSTALRLAPDGIGGVEWGTGGGGGGGGGGWGFDLADYAFTTLSGWTQFGSPTVCDITTVPGWLYLKKNTSGSVALCGVYKAQPSYPFTLDAVVVASTPPNGNFERVSGLFVAEAGLTGKVEAVHGDVNSNIEYAVVAYTNITNFSSSPANVVGFTLSLHPPIFYRIVAASTSDVSYYFSHDGILWRSIILNRDPGFTIGAIGLMADSEQTNHAVEHAVGIHIY